MGARFGRDFTAVRIHTDPLAAASASSVHAAAYTLGRHIVFGADRYAPATNAGQDLLTHELVHVLQQTDIAQPLVPSSPVRRANAPPDQTFASSATSPDDSAPASASLVTHHDTPRLMRTINYHPDCTPNLPEVQRNVPRAQASAIRWVDAAVISLGTPDRVSSLLWRHFRVRAANAAAVTQIRQSFERIDTYLAADGFTYYCRPASDPGCTTPHGVTASAYAYPGRLKIYFCDPFPFQDFFGHRDLIDTLLHEAAHAHDAGFKHDTYEWQSAYPGSNPLTNAESFASFARDVALGRGGINLELAVGGVMAAEPQFYIAVGASGDVGGPFVDALNLRLGARVAFTPQAGTEPARLLFAGDIGLRINPIRERVYVDLTTGAFWGANFTDNAMMAGIASRLSGGYRGERVDLGLDLSDFYDLVAGRNLVVVGVRVGGRF